MSKGKSKKLVGILMGSKSDYPVMGYAAKALDEFGISYEVKVLSAHRMPDAVRRYAKRAPGCGIKVIIAGAGGAAHLAGAIAAQTSLPVIGVPIETKSLKGLDSLLSTVQMPSGVPVATMAIGESGARNSGILAAQIIGVSNSKVIKRIELYKKRMGVKYKR